MEKPITNKIITGLNKNPFIWVRKRYSSGMTGTKGWPDVTGVITLERSGLLIGVRIEIEVKQRGKNPTSIQYSRLRRFRKLGCVAFWTDNYEDCLEKFWYQCSHVGLLNHDYKDLHPTGKITIVKEL